VWDWPTMPGTFGFPDGKQEIYTTCMDIDVVGDTGIVPASKAQINYAQGQPYDIAAVADQMSDLANPTAVTGSTIAFSASATGPAAGGASEASISAATASDTGVPGFLSIHTGSVAGPGLETQTFTVVPIGVTGSPQVTGAPNAVGNAQQVATFTEYESITQTLLQTVYVTKYTKRDAEPVATSAPSPTTSTDHSAFRLRARNPFVLLGWMSGSSEAQTTQTS